MKENIWYEFPCPECECDCRIGSAMFNSGWNEEKHYYCSHCDTNFNYIIDFDNNIKYIIEDC